LGRVAGALFLCLWKWLGGGGVGTY
jgi:hypothetical protein